MLMYNKTKEYPITRTAMQQLVTPPAMGRFHKPYSFYDYTSEVVSSLGQEGFFVADEEYVVSNDNNRMFGVIELGLRGDQDFTINIGVRGSHDQRIPRGLAIGSKVFVCSNLCFHGSLGNFKTRQTLNIEGRIHGLIREATAQVGVHADRQKQVFDAYRNFQIKWKWMGDAALVELHRRGALNASQLSKAISEWDNPSYEEHTQYGRTAWQLFNAATEALKGSSNMMLVQDRSTTISDYFNNSVVHV
jgi:hypothetical protein